MPVPAVRTSRAPRPAYLAPPPLLRETEGFEGAALLREHPGALGVLLWRTVRDLAAWTDSTPEERGALFPAGAAAAREAEVAAAGADPEAWAPLLVVARLLEGDGADHARVVHACRSLARWAERRRLPAAHLAFTQAAARLAPEHPRLAYAVGRLARDRGEHARAESWLRTAIRLARGRDWHTYALAYLSLGTLYQQIGNYPAARAVTLRGIRTAGRRGHPGLQGSGYHNLVVVAAEAGDYPRAQEYAALALDAYGPAHARLPALAYDVGCVWFLSGCFERALQVMEAALRHLPTGPERAIVLANAARAAAACGERSRFERYSEEGATEAELHGVHPLVADAWLNLARAAFSIGEPLRAEAALGRAAPIAEALRLRQISLEIEAAREAALGTMAVPEPSRRGRGAVLPGAVALAARLVRTLDPAATS